MKKEEVISRLKNSKNEQEWNSICKEVKHDNQGQYPSWWYKEVISTGMGYCVLGKSAEICQVTLDDDHPKKNRGAGTASITKEECATIAEFLSRSGIKNGVINIRSRNAIYINGGLYTLDEIESKLQEMDASEDAADQRSTYNE